MAINVEVNQDALRKALLEVFHQTMKDIAPKVARSETSQIKQSYTDGMEIMSYEQSKWSPSIKSPIWTGDSQKKSFSKFLVNKKNRVDLLYKVDTSYAYQFLHGRDVTNWIPKLHSRYGKKRNVMAKTLYGFVKKKRFQKIINTTRGRIYYK